MLIDPECYHYCCKGQEMKTFPKCYIAPTPQVPLKTPSLGSALELSGEQRTLKHNPFVSPGFKQRLLLSSTAGQSRNGLGKGSQAKP